MSFLFAVEHVKFRDCSTLLRGEIEVVVAVMFILSLSLLSQLIAILSLTGHRVDVLLDTRSGIESHVHNIQGCLAGLFVHLCRLAHDSRLRHILRVATISHHDRW